MQFQIGVGGPDLKDQRSVILIDKDFVAGSCRPKNSSARGHCPAHHRVLGLSTVNAVFENTIYRAASFIRVPQVVVRTGSDAPYFAPACQSANRHDGGLGNWRRQLSCCDNRC